jgi:hypothetical protein
MPMKCNESSLVCQPPHDHQFLEKLKCDENTVYIFDKDIMITKPEHFTEHKTGFVTRIKENAKFEVTQVNSDTRSHSYWCFVR